MIVRYEEDIFPALLKDQIVVCDRYYWTSLVRDKIRGVDPEIPKMIYKDFRHPDFLFHCTAPLSVSLSRILDDKRLTYFGAGMDLGLAHNREENFIKYTKMMDQEYKKILKGQENYYHIDMDRHISEIAEEIKGIISKKLGIGRYESPQ
jgi:thymidylate kinase